MTIEYTTGSWNPVLGCSAIASGCAHCYAAREASTRLAHLADYAGLASGGKWTGKLVSRGEKTWLAPFHWRKPRVLFVCSTSDLFHEQGDFTWIDRAWATMALCPDHTFLLPTKRIARAAAHLSSPMFYQRVLTWADELRRSMPASNPCHRVTISDPAVKPLRNVWLGTSASTQRELLANAAELSSAPAYLRWLSIEPQIEGVSVAATGLIRHEGIWENAGASLACRVCGTVKRVGIDDAVCPAPASPIDWVVCGGESGPKSRPFELEWAEKLAAEMAEARVPFYFKQTGANAAYNGKPFQTRHRKGEDPAEWPEHLRIRQRPEFARIAHAGDIKLTYPASE